MIGVKKKPKQLDISTLALLNAEVADATLVDTTDPRFTNDRTPLAHNHSTSDITGLVSVPAPYLEDLIPDSYLPSTTGNFVITGSFFTPTMTVVIEGVTINGNVIFISDNEVHVNGTSGATVGEMDVTLNNGVEAIFPNRLLIVLGTVFKPKLADFTNVTRYTQTDSTLELSVATSYHSAEWLKTCDITKDFEIRVNYKSSPLASAFTYNDGRLNGGAGLRLDLLKVSDSSSEFYFRSQAPNILKVYKTVGAVFQGNTGVLSIGSGSVNANQHYNQDIPVIYRWDKTLLEFRVYFNGDLKGTFPYVLPENVTMQFSSSHLDSFDIKYIELAV